MKVARNNPIRIKTSAQIKQLDIQEFIHNTELARTIKTPKMFAVKCDNITSLKTRKLSLSKIAGSDSNLI